MGCMHMISPLIREDMIHHSVSQLTGPSSCEYQSSSLINQLRNKENPHNHLIWDNMIADVFYQNSREVGPSHVYTVTDRKQLSS